MKSKSSTITILVLLAGIFVFSAASAQMTGSDIFNKTCRACHTIKKGDLVGPDLADVSNRRSDEWIKKFVRSSQGMVNSGDKDAVAVYNKYGKTVMPDQNFTDGEFISLIDYIKAQSGGAVDTSAAAMVSAKPLKPLSEALPGDIDNGRKLFEGRARFINGGPACISCHNVRDDKMIGGGLLAKDLTHVYGRMPDMGVRSILSGLTFPAMKNAYQNDTLNEDEIFALAAFLNNSNIQGIYQHNRNYNNRFLWTGILGSSFMLMAFAGLWFNRRLRTVNHEIYKRQVKGQDQY